MASLELPDRNDLARELFFSQPQGFPFGNFQLEEVLLPPGEDFGISSDVEDDVEDDPVEQESGFGNVIVVDGLPEVGEEKYEKLSNVIRKIFSQIGVIRDGGFHMPKDESGTKTCGYAFIEFSSPQEAQAAHAQTQGYALDKKHRFTVNMFDDFQKYDAVPEEYVPPPATAHKPRDDLLTFLQDSRGRDQFVLRYQSETEVHWNDAHKHVCEEIYKRSFWTERFVQWSPQGTMLATVHRQGVAIWGGTNFERLNRYGHSHVQLLDFSPNEKYLVTYSSTAPPPGEREEGVLLMVFDAATGAKLRVFQGSAKEFCGTGAGAKGEMKWPVFKWAGGKEDLYLAKMTKNAVQVYEAPGMNLLQKRSVKLENVEDFEWSPDAPILCAYQGEQAGGNLPARVSLLELPSRNELRQKNLFMVSDVKMYWHPQGSYLAVKVDRFTKRGKSTYTGFEIFRMKEKDIPIDVLELPNNKEKILACAWEPKGHRFAIVHGDGPRPTVSLYDMRQDKNSLQGVKLLGTFPNKQVNALFWSPNGRHLVMAGLKGHNGILEFFNADEMTTMNTAEHFMCTDVDWDPTGRYVATSVTIGQMENGFVVWAFNGRQMYKVNRDNFWQFLWRPRPPSLLPPEKEREIQRNLRKYSVKYDEMDAQLLMETDEKVVAERQAQYVQWRQWQESRAEWVASQTEFEKNLYGPLFEEPAFTLESVAVEQTIDVKEEPYNAS